MIVRYGLVALSALIMLNPIMPLMAESCSAPSKRVVYANDLENGMQIIGLLGLPLGELASVRAKIVPSNSKETDRYIEILEVNNNRLSMPLQLMFSVWQWGNLSNKALPLDQVLSLRLYETGGMAGVPQKAMTETMYVESIGWGFRTSVVILYEEK